MGDVVMEDAAPTAGAAGRSRRSNAGKRRGVDKALSALQQMRSHRDVGGSLVESYEVSAPEAVFDYVDESEYRKIVAQRQEEDFVIAEDGGENMYLDRGAEIWDYYSGDEEFGERGPRRALRREKGLAALEKRAMKKREQKRRAGIDAAFLGGGANVVGPGMGGDVNMTDAVATVGDDDEFAALLRDLEADPTGDSNLMASSSSKRNKGRRAADVALFGSSVLAAQRAAGTSARSGGAARGNFRSRATKKEAEYEAMLAHRNDGLESLFDDEDAATTSRQPAKRRRVDTSADFSAADDGMAEIDYDDVDSTAAHGSPSKAGVVGAKVKDEVMTTPTQQLQSNRDSPPRVATKAEVEVSRGNALPSAPVRKSNVGTKKKLNKKNLKKRMAAAEAVDGPSPLVLGEDTSSLASKQQNDWFAMSQTAGADTAADPSSSPSADTKGKSAAPARRYKRQSIPRNADGDVEFFYLDAHEERYSPGTIYLFGKVRVEDGSFESTCLIVRNYPRIVQFLPRPDAETGEQPESLKEVGEEVQDILTAQGITKFRSRVRPMRYCLDEPDVPEDEVDYYEVQYDASLPRLPSELSGSTFSRVFGTQTTCIENFVLQRGLMGPSWLVIKNATDAVSPASWCKFEIEVGTAKAIEVMEEAPPAPPLVCMALSLKTVLSETKHANEILAISALIHDGVNADSLTAERNYKHFSIVRTPPGGAMPFDFKPYLLNNGLNKDIYHENSERALLNRFLAFLATYDPDVLVGHNILGFDVDVLLHRMQALKIGKNWSKMGRLNRVTMPKLQAGPGGTGSTTWGERTATAGRLLCDTYLQARQLISSRNYSLSMLSQSLLGIERTAIDSADILALYETTPRLIEMIKHTENDAFLAFGVMFKLNIIPLTKQITNLCGNLWSRTLIGGRAERVDFLLLHEFNRLDFVRPEKVWKNKGGAASDGPKPAKRKKAAYAGGLVLAPKKGFYDTFILLLDFNSLYPSIIQEFNICFTTVKRAKGAEATTVDEHGNEEIVLGELPGADAERGVLPRVIKTLIDQRGIVKTLMKSETDVAKKAQYDVRQKALKLTANSMYGCLGASVSRFHAPAIAALITSQGRDILQATVDLTQETLGYEVIYGDTDSIMVNSNIADDVGKVKKIAAAIKREVNKTYNLLEIDIDGIFRSMLLLKKKKYAALMIQENRDGSITYVKETKGLDLVRRDWCGLSKRVGNYILDQILSGAPRDDVVAAIHSHLRELREAINAGSIPIDEFVITKGLTKDPSDYADAKAQPHVQVALALRKQGKIARAGDHIAYVITEGDGATSSARARDPGEVERDTTGELRIDVEWYLTQQILPPISRLCEPIDGTDAGMIADCLGLDPAKYRNLFGADEDYEDMLTPAISQTDEEKYRGCERLHVTCPHCARAQVYHGVFRKVGADRVPGLRCGFVSGNDDAASAASTTTTTTTTSTTSTAVASRACPGRFTTARVWNAVVKAMRGHLQDYYSGFMVCDDTVCSNRTRQMCLRGGGLACLVPGCTGSMRPEYSSHDVYLQMLYYFSLFDIERALEQIRGDDIRAGAATLLDREDYDTLDELKTKMFKELGKNAHHFVDLGSLFSFYK